MQKVYPFWASVSPLCHTIPAFLYHFLYQHTRDQGQLSIIKHAVYKQEFLPWDDTYLGLARILYTYTLYTYTLYVTVFMVISLLQ